jgi:hypothetical protein
MVPKGWAVAQHQQTANGAIGVRDSRRYQGLT